MPEIELKFSVPSGRLASVAAEARRASRSLLMSAIYFDTQDRRLSDAGISVRLRREGGRWVQTAKAPGRAPADRHEHNVPRRSTPTGSTKLRPELALHDGTPVGAAIRRALGRTDPQRAELDEVFRTEVRRHRRTEQVAGTEVELALDAGEIVAGDRRQAINEIEFELKAGPPVGLFTLARRWVKRHGLWLDGRSKAERGDWLSRGEAGAPPRKAGNDDPHAIEAASGETDLLRSLINAALRQVIANSSEVACGRETPDHVHQLRVGLRRLRTALRTFGDGALALADCEKPLAEVFRALGAWRDPAVTRESIIPRLQDAGAPSVDLPVSREEQVSPAKLVHGTAFQLALLSMMEFGMAASQASEAGAGTRAHEGPLDAAIAARLTKLHKQVRRDGRRFEKLPEEKQHRVRKRLKRLRYLAEFVAPRYKHRAVKRYLAALEPAQDALGAHNDAVVAVEGFRAAARTEPLAWFAVGWLTARLDESAARSRRALKAIEGDKRFWR